MSSTPSNKNEKKKKEEKQWTCEKMEELKKKEATAKKIYETAAWNNRSACTGDGAAFSYNCRQHNKRARVKKRVYNRLKKSREDLEKKCGKKSFQPNFKF